MSANTRKCTTCGMEYDFCINSCKNHSGEIWKAAFHDEACRDVYNIAAKYAGGSLSATDAKKALDKLVMPKRIVDHIQTVINEINTEASKNVAKPVVKVEAPKADVKPAEAKV